MRAWFAVQGWGKLPCTANHWIGGDLRGSASFDRYLDECLRLQEERTLS
jgi:hypothetical protein